MKTVKMFDGDLYVLVADAVQMAENAYKNGQTDEREACAKVCDELAELNRTSPTDSMWEQEECAAAIRARGVASIRSNT